MKQRVILTINTKSKKEAIAALETALEKVKKMHDEGPLKQKLIVESENCDGTGFLRSSLTVK